MALSLDCQYLRGALRAQRLGFCTVWGCVFSEGGGYVLWEPKR